MIYYFTYLSTQPIFSVEADSLDTAFEEFSIYAAESGLDRENPCFMEFVEVWDESDFSEPSYDPSLDSDDVVPF